MTLTDDSAIAAAAMIGDSRMPKNGYNTPAATGTPEVLRGSEWYHFQNGKIAEIRSYHANYFLAKPDNRELWDFDYDGRGYTPKGK